MLGKRKFDHDAGKKDDRKEEATMTFEQQQQKRIIPWESLYRGTADPQYLDGSALKKALIASGHAKLYRGFTDLGHLIFDPKYLLVQMLWLDSRSACCESTDIHYVGFAEPFVKHVLHGNVNVPVMWPGGRIPITLFEFAVQCSRTEFAKELYTTYKQPILTGVSNSMSSRMGLLRWIFLHAIHPSAFRDIIADTILSLTDTECNQPFKFVDHKKWNHLPTFDLSYTCVFEFATNPIITRNSREFRAVLLNRAGLDGSNIKMKLHAFCNDAESQTIVDELSPFRAYRNALRTRAERILRKKRVLLQPLITVVIEYLPPSKELTIQGLRAVAV